MYSLAHIAYERASGTFNTWGTPLKSILDSLVLTNGAYAHRA